MTEPAPILLSLKLHRSAWTHVSAAAVNAAGAIVVGASVLFLLNRFGGQVLESPRASLRLIVIGVWGWLGLAGAIWLAGRLLASERPVGGLPVTGAVGIAHGPLLLVGVTMFISVGFLEYNGPGRVAGLIVFVLWIPAMLVAAVEELYDTERSRAALIVALPYLAWVGLVVTPLYDQFAHLL